MTTMLAADSVGTMRDVSPGPADGPPASPPAGETDQTGDTLDGGAGNDRLRTRDGEVDRVTCGSGRDRADLDTVDVVVDATLENPNGSCEVVVRAAPKASDSRSEDREERPADAARTT
jgi:hypothetical protein